MTDPIKDLLVKSGIPNEDIMDIFSPDGGKINEFYLNNFAQAIIKETVKRIIYSYKGHINPTTGVNAVNSYFEVKI